MGLILLTFQGIFKELLRKVSGPFVLTTSLDLFVNPGHKVVAHVVQQGHKVFQHLQGNHLLVQDDAV